MRECNPGNRRACLLTFGKRHKDLTPEEWKQWRRMQHLANYYTRYKANKKWARKVPHYRKQSLLTALGWAAECSRCGYSKCLAALEFHHKPGVHKIGEVMSLYPQEKRKEEALKCELICANCHRELHTKEPRSQNPDRKTTRRPLDPLTATYFHHLGVVRPGDET